MNWVYVETSALLEVVLGQPREAEVLAWAARGKTNWEIATILSVRRRTVATHLERIYAKLDVTSRSAAVARVFGRPLSAI